ncbi:hypothetical protein TSUD_184330 [Trifolium subterraneum]|uniref:Endonuclease/exonuclease/phosphatase domain-containing protein n=1 Tax=Trifolium subterraneum TaxID=3900 RepID=A0A2Z6P2E2_TRISU|nr:hypothetical protein TSUD_184330 [Trifolium subterraneum]
MELWLLTVVYASPIENERRDTWIKLHDIARTIQEPWLMMGDFNEIMSTNEKKGGAPVDIRRFEVAWITHADFNKMLTDNLGEEIVDREHVVSWNTYPHSIESHHDRLGANVQFSERKKALFEMGPHKAPGKDGYLALFFQQCWDIVGNSLFQFVNQTYFSL